MKESASNRWAFSTENFLVVLALEKIQYTVFSPLILISKDKDLTQRLFYYCFKAYIKYIEAALIFLKKIMSFYFLNSSFNLLGNACFISTFQTIPSRIHDK